MLQDLVPCLICEKAVVYYAPTTGTVAAASYLVIKSVYPSNFEDNIYNGIICDDCLDKSIQSNRLLANI
jgi:hypothetical protein